MGGKNNSQSGSNATKDETQHYPDIQFCNLNIRLSLDSYSEESTLKVAYTQFDKAANFELIQKDRT